MPTYVEAFNFEKCAPKGTIRLIQSGEFYRAYNHSAWLFVTVIASHKVVRKFIKSINEDIYFVGFPCKSLLSNIGDRKSVATDFGFDIELREDEIPDESEYEVWLKTVQAESSSKADFLSLPLAGADAEREVISRIKDFAIESSTPIECLVFLSQLKSLLKNK